MTPQPDKAQQAAGELRELIRQAHEAAQDLKAVMREARAQVDEYAAQQVVVALNEYTRQMQEHVSDTERAMVDDLLEMREKGRRALQAIADSHTEIFLALFELTEASTEPPRNDFLDRRKKLIDIGRRLRTAYDAANVEYKQVKDEPEQLQEALRRATASER